MDVQEIEAFQERFRAWLGVDPEAGARIAARRSGYSLKYVRWAAGLIGRKPWPGSRPFVRQMTALGCSDAPWCDRSPEELQRAFREREVLHDPEGNEKAPGGGNVEVVKPRRGRVGSARRLLDATRAGIIPRRGRK